MAITPSMEKVMKVNVWDCAQMHVHRAALAAIAGGIVGCTAHPIPSTALAELPLAGLAAMGPNSAGTLLPDARTDGSTLLFDDPNRVIRLANFDLSDPAPRDAARPRDLAAPIDTLTEFVRFHQHGSEYAVLRLPWVRAPQPPTPHIQPSWESPDRAKARGQWIKAKKVSTSMIAGDTTDMMRQLPVESISGMTVVAPE
jgi:hypothetical protein